MMGSEKRRIGMNRNTFILLMVVEGFLALVSMGLLFSDVGAIIYLYTAVGLSVVLAPFAVRLKREEDEAKKRKIRRNMALILLVPIVAALIVVTLVIIALILTF